MHAEAIKRGDYEVANDLKEMIFDIESNKPKGVSNKMIFTALGVAVCLLIINLIS